MFNIYFHKPKFLILFDNLWQNMSRSMSKLTHLVHFSYCLDQNMCNYKSTKISLKKQKYKLKYQKQKMLFIMAIDSFFKQPRIFSEILMLNAISEKYYSLLFDTMVINLALVCTYRCFTISYEH